MNGPHAWQVLNRLFTIEADAAFPRYRWNLLLRRTFPQHHLQHGVGGMRLTITDMNRLEQAARISMGEFQDAEEPAPPPPATHALLWISIIGLTAVIVAVTLFQLAY